MINTKVTKVCDMKFWLLFVELDQKTVHEISLTVQGHYSLGCKFVQRPLTKTSKTSKQTQKSPTETSNNNQRSLKHITLKSSKNHHPSIQRWKTVGFHFGTFTRGTSRARFGDRRALNPGEKAEDYMGHLV